MLGGWCWLLKNEYKIVNGVIYFRLYSKKHGTFTCKVDEIHYDKLVGSKLKWHLLWSNTVKRYYAKATKYNGMINGKPSYETVLLHRFLTDCPDDMTVDHLNYDTLDNRDCNLKLVTIEDNSKRKENRANRNSKTGIRNVSYSAFYNKYIVQFYVNGKNMVIGKYDTLQEAREVADKNRNKHYMNVG